MIKSIAIVVAASGAMLFGAGCAVTQNSTSDHDRQQVKQTVERVESSEHSGVRDSPFGD